MIPPHPPDFSLHSGYKRRARELYEGQRDKGIGGVGQCALLQGRDGQSFELYTRPLNNPVYKRMYVCLSFI